MQMESVSPGDARSRAEAGEWVIVDVRPESDFEKASAEGAVNVPLFQAVNLSQATPLSLLRAVAMGVNGVKPVEPNPNFDEQLKERTAGKKAIMVRTQYHCACPITQQAPQITTMNALPSPSVQHGWHRHT